MKRKDRIKSILDAPNIDPEITNIQSFDLSVLDIPTNIEFQLPTNLRLGHLIERIVSEYIKSSSNYILIDENIQLIEDKKTLGEIDFLIEEKQTKEIIHLELAYKFYLFDPNNSSTSKHNWIGPNRKDALRRKIEKLKNKQFPLLYHNCTRSKFSTLEVSDITQAICFLALLYTPYLSKPSINSMYNNAVVGYYVNYETFIRIDNPAKRYYIPQKTEWGIDPAKNESWEGLMEVEPSIVTMLNEKRSPLCWQKYEDSYLTFFIVWW